MNIHCEIHHNTALKCFMLTLLSVISGIGLFWLLECYHDTTLSRLLQHFVKTMMIMVIMAVGLKMLFSVCLFSSQFLLIVLSECVDDHPDLYESCQWNANSPGRRMGLLLCSNSCLSVFLFQILFSLSSSFPLILSLYICRCSHDAAARRTS